MKKAYHGYLICWSPFTVTNRDDGFWIEKDGYHIGYAKSEADAKRIIDEVLS